MPSVVLADNVIEREELAILLALALKKLTEKQHNTIKAMYFEGFSGKEIAAKLKIKRLRRLQNTISRR